MVYLLKMVIFYSYVKLRGYYPCVVWTIHDLKSCSPCLVDKNPWPGFCVSAGYPKISWLMILRWIHKLTIPFWDTSKIILLFMQKKWDIYSKMFIYIYIIYILSTYIYIYVYNIQNHIVLLLMQKKASLISPRCSKYMPRVIRTLKWFAKLKDSAIWCHLGMIPLS